MKKMVKLSTFLLLLVLFTSNNLFSQINEGFEGVTFPPTGWTNPSVVIGNGDFYQINVAPHSGTYCAISEYTSAGADNYLITPQFTPVANDSIVFWYSQQFTAVYDDSLEVRVSTTNNLPASFTVRLKVLKDGIDYPLPGGGSTYARVAVSLGAYTGTPIYVAFRHADLDGENIRIDDVSTTNLNPPAPDVTTTANLSPVGNIVLNSSTIAPKATFQNIGGLPTGSFNVTYKISPGGYTSTKSISLLASASATVTFDSTFVPNTAGTYNVTIYPTLAADLNKSNDTLKTTFNVKNINFGSGTGGNFFANSLATGAPSMPEVCWADYSGGTTLCLDGVNNDAAIYTGSSLDDGYWRIGDILPAGYHIRLNGVNYDSIFLGTNGIIGLTNQNTNNADFSPSVLPDATQNTALYPFWSDFDFRTVTGNSYIKYIVRGTKLYIYYLARTYNSGNASPNAIFFGTSIELVNSTTDSRVVYQYGDEDKGTTTTFIDDLNDNFLADNLIGLQSGASLYTTYREVITNINIPGPVFATLSGGELAVEFGPDANALNQKCASLTVTVSLQYCPSDSITVSLYDASNCNLVDTKKGYYTGASSIKFDMAGTDNIANFYIKVNQKNSLEIWSNQFSISGFAASYDFTSAQSQEFSGNLIFNGSDWSMISGDVTQDGAIDASDLAGIENDTEFGIPTIYPTDLNCDDFVDASDLAGCENNQGTFAGAPCAPAPNRVRISGPNDGYKSLPEVNKSRETSVKNNDKLRSTVK